MSIFIGNRPLSLQDASPQGKAVPTFLPPCPSAEIHLPEGIKILYPSDCGDSVLDVLLNAGYNAPYSCQAGACMSCLAEVEEGCVVQDDPACLSDSDIAEKKALMCQARPASSQIKIRFLE